MTNGESLSLIRVNWLTKIFVTGDIISFLVQAAGIPASYSLFLALLMAGLFIGGGILANADTSSERKNGERVITIGLIVQLVFFGIFILVALNFHHRLSNHPNHTSKTVPWKSGLIVLYIASMLIMVRSVFRVIEYVQGEDGALLRKEIWLYVFDAAQMFQMMLLFNWKHPGLLAVMRQKRRVIYRTARGRSIPSTSVRMVGPRHPGRVLSRRRV
ncbi:hypothetical protein SLS56_011185 [Neofusicoccum ribis]|uniref:Rta1 domain protein n=1 Tax=Neofusicoccum ribis TaxID=45134 RepID=A0ABR3SDA1_9PEZI